MPPTYKHIFKSYLILGWDCQHYQKAASLFLHRIFVHVDHKVNPSLKMTTSYHHFLYMDM
jgi:hypothetical protein